MQAILQQQPAIPRAHGNRTLSLCLIAIGLMAMIAVMYMTGRFGWSLQDDQGDRIASATLHVLVDASAAALIAASGLMASWRSWRATALSWIASLCAVILVAYSILSVYGFMSTRVAHLEAHKNLVQAEKADLDWKRQTAIQKDVPKSERLYLRKETRAAEGALLKSLGIIPDAQAVAIAQLFGTTAERVQRALVIVSSSVGQLIKVSCLFIGFGLWPQRQNNPPNGSTERVQMDRSNEPPGAEIHELRPGTKWTHQAAMRDLRAHVERSRPIPHRNELRKRWNVSHSTAKRWLKEFHGGAPKRLGERKYVSTG